MLEKLTILRATIASSGSSLCYFPPSIIGPGDRGFLLEVSGAIIVCIPPTQNPLECLSELWTEDGVDYWVESGVEISQPEEETSKENYNTKH